MRSILISTLFSLTFTFQLAWGEAGSEPIELPKKDLIPCGKEAISWFTKNYSAPKGYQISLLKDVTKYIDQRGYEDNTIMIRFSLKSEDGKLLCKDGMVSISGRVADFLERGKTGPNLCETDNRFRFTKAIEINDKRLLDDNGDFQNPRQPSTCGIVLE